MKRDEILDILIENAGNTVSGGFMANRLGISRNSVWKNINALKKDGYIIESLNNRGYVLSDKVSYLSKKVIEKNLDTSFIGRNLEVTDSVDSTNTRLKNIPDSERQDGMVLVSDMQTGGRGRLGRSFVSPMFSGCYLSVMLRPRLPVSELNLITVIAAVAAVKAVKEVSGTDCSIKWVNDIMKDDRKIAGILTEGLMSVETGHVDWVVMGIGINTKRYEKLPEELKDIVGYLGDFADFTVDRNRLIAAFLNEFEHLYSHMNRDELYSFYRNNMLYMGEKIRFTDGGSERNGILKDLEKDFSLIIRDDSGKERKYSSGEISIRG